MKRTSVPARTFPLISLVVLVASCGRIEVRIDPDGAALAAGESATFTATVTGGDGSTLAWYVDDAPQAEETGSTYTFVAWPEVQTDYTVKVVATLESRTAEASVSVSVSAPESPRSPTTWVATTSVPVSNAGMSAVVCDGYLYLVGCRTVNGGARSGVYYAPIGADGGLGSWSTGAEMPAEISGFGLEAYDGRLYLVGGYVQTESFNGRTECYVSAIGSGGANGAWTETASLPAGRWLGQSQIIGSRLYYLGGVGVYPGVSVTAYVTEVQADGNLSAWTESTAFTGARAGSSGLYYADTLYLTGGLQFSPGDDFSDIQRITADSTGDLGAWWVNDSGGLPLERYAHYSWEVDGVFWIIGGMKVNAATYEGVPQMDVIHAEIGPDHSVSVFETDELGLPVESLSDFGAVYHDGYLYVVGGAVGSTWQSGAFSVAFE